MAVALILTVGLLLRSTPEKAAMTFMNGFINKDLDAMLSVMPEAYLDIYADWYEYNNIQELVRAMEFALENDTVYLTGAYPVVHSCKVISTYDATSDYYGRMMVADLISEFPYSVGFEMISSYKKLQLVELEIEFQGNDHGSVGTDTLLVGSKGGKYYILCPEIPYFLLG